MWEATEYKYTKPKNVLNGKQNFIALIYAGHIIFAQIITLSLAYST